GRPSDRTSEEITTKGNPFSSLLGQIAQTSPRGKRCDQFASTTLCILIIQWLAIKGGQTQDQTNLRTKQNGDINEWNGFQASRKGDDSRVADDTLRCHAPIGRKFTPHSQSSFRASL